MTSPLSPAAQTVLDALINTRQVSRLLGPTHPTVPTNQP
jgi:hypothetical protein